MLQVMVEEQQRELYYAALNMKQDTATTPVHQYTSIPVYQYTSTE